jgi:hypothetical protein
MKSYLTAGLLVAAALAIGGAVLPEAIAAKAVQGTGQAFHLVPDPGGSPPVKDGAPVVGAKGTIHRTSKGVTINIHTVGLDSQHACTVWVFEVNCGAAACRPVQLAGHIVGASGKGNFSGHLGLNADPTRPVQDPFGGDFHCVIVDHGPIDPSDMPNAIKSPLPPFSPDGTQNWEQVMIFAP